MFDHLLESSRWDNSNKWSNIGFGQEIKELASIEIHFTHLIWHSGTWDSLISQMRSLKDSILWKVKCCTLSSHLNPFLSPLLCRKITTIGHIIENWVRNEKIGIWTKQDRTEFLSDQIEQSVILLVSSGTGLLYLEYLSGTAFIRAIPIYTNSCLAVMRPLDSLH